MILTYWVEMFITLYTKMSLGGSGLFLFHLFFILKKIKMYELQIGWNNWECQHTQNVSLKYQIVWNMEVFFGNFISMGEKNPGTAKYICMNLLYLHYLKEQVSDMLSNVSFCLSVIIYALVLVGFLCVTFFPLVWFTPLTMRPDHEADRFCVSQITHNSSLITATVLERNQFINFGVCDKIMVNSRWIIWKYRSEYLQICGYYHSL